MEYLPTFDSIKSHPLPGWFDRAKLGIFVHWGLYSIPAFAPLKKKGQGNEQAAEGRVTLLATGDRLRVECSAEGKPIVEMPAGVQANAIPVIKVQIS